MNSTVQHVSFTIGWSEFTNDDLLDDDGEEIPPDKGWYVTVELPNGSGYDIGPDHFGDGFGTTGEPVVKLEDVDLAACDPCPSCGTPTRRFASVPIRGNGLDGEPSGPWHCDACVQAKCDAAAAAIRPRVDVAS